MSNCKNSCTNCNCKEVEIPAPSWELTGQGKPKDKAPICPAKKQLSVLKKQEARRAKKLKNGIEYFEAHRAHVGNATAIIVILLVIPAFLGYCFWAGDDANTVALWSLLACVFFTGIAAWAMLVVAKNSHTIVAILEDMDNVVEEDLQP